MSGQVVSKQRVADHGEVFTDQREVDAMLDLVAQETARIESRFLEPACGTGNFLAEILTRKLKTVDDRYRRSQVEYERYAILAVASVYGVELLEDNVRMCRERLFGIFDRDFYRQRFGSETKEECRAAAIYILERNIVWGDALTLRTAGEPAAPITFSEWSAVGSGQIKRRDYSFQTLLVHEARRELPLFSDLGEEAFIPQPEKEYPPCHFTELMRVQQ